jgi:YD repeat-containing protein
MAFAGVNPGNGDFFISYTDAKIPGAGYEVEMSRTYNSKSTNLGWFGYGWGSPLDTHLIVMPDRSVAIVENGDVKTSFFHDASARINPKRITSGVARIIAAAKTQDKLSDLEVLTLTKKLLDDEEERLLAVRKYHIESQLPLGRTYIEDSTGICVEKLQRTESGFIRDNSCGSVDEFDKRGNLTKLTRDDGDDGYQLTFQIENDHPVEIADSNGQSFKLSWTLDGQIKKLIASDGKTITYKYDDDHNLILSNEIKGNFYRYDYDHNHNMTRIGYIDGSSKYITYGAAGVTTSVSETNGARTLYEYIPIPKVSTTYSTRIRNIYTDGVETSKTLSFQDVFNSTSEYNRKNSTIKMQVCDEITELDSKGRILTKKSSSGDVMSYTYHPTMDKVVTVMLNDKLRAKFSYSDAGDLIHAEDSAGKSADFEYDINKHISRMITTNQAGIHEQLNFKYNDNGKTIEIKHPEFGVITVEYDAKGEISKVGGIEGSKTAIRVVNAFSDMLALLHLANF